MARIGYARSPDQNELDRQVALLSDSCEIVRSDCRENLRGDTELKALLKFLTNTDTLVICNLVQIATTLNELKLVADILIASGADIEIIESPILSDVSSYDIYRCIIAINSFQKESAKGLQAEGIEKAKRSNKYRGRAAKVDKEKVIQLLNDQVPVAEIARELKCTPDYIYKLRRDLQGKSKSRKRNIT